MGERESGGGETDNEVGWVASGGEEPRGDKLG